MFRAVQLLFVATMLVIVSLPGRAKSLPEDFSETTPEAPVFPIVLRQEFRKSHPSSAELRALAGRAERDAVGSCQSAGHDRCELAAITALDCADTWRSQERGTVCEARAWAGPVPDGPRP